MNDDSAQSVADSHRVSHAHFSIVDLGEEGKDDWEHWRNASVEERLEYVEYLRYINYGDVIFKPMVKSFEIVDFPPDEEEKLPAMSYEEAVAKYGVRKPVSRA